MHTVSPPTTIALAAVCGAGLGCVYFFLLWSTVRALPRQRHPARWTSLALLARLALVLAGFTASIRWGGWPALLATLGGFLLVRMLLVRKLRPAAGEPVPEP